MSKNISKAAVDPSKVPVSDTSLGSKKFKVLKQETKHLVSILATLYRKSYGFGEQPIGKIGEVEIGEIKWVITKDAGPAQTTEVKIEAFEAYGVDPRKNKLVYSYHTGRAPAEKEQWEGGTDPIEQLLHPVDKIHAGLQALQNWFTDRSSDIEWAVQRLQKLAQYPVKV